MAKMTLLEIVQACLSSMDSDDVNSIDDTEESLQVALEVKYTYEELMSQKEWGHLNTLCTLESLGDTTRPTTVKMDDAIAVIHGMEYEVTDTGDADRSWADILYKEPKLFLSNARTLSSSDTNVETSVQDGVQFLVTNDTMPVFWTSFDDETIVMDSYKNTVESTLQGQKVTVQCNKHSAWTVSDTFVPDIPEKMFPLLLASSKEACHLYFKQQVSAIDAKRAVRGLNTMRDQDDRAHNSRKRTRFGRC